MNDGDSRSRLYSGVESRLDGAGRGTPEDEEGAELSLRPLLRLEPVLRLELGALCARRTRHENHVRRGGSGGTKVCYTGDVSDGDPGAEKGDIHPLSFSSSMYDDRFFFFVSFECKRDEMSQMVILAFLLFLVVEATLKKRRRRRGELLPSKGEGDNFEARMELVTVDGNEAMVIDSVLAGERTLFHLDTGYAGPPVLSKTFLSVQNEVDVSKSVRSRLLDGHTRMRKIRNEADAQERGVSDLLSSRKCRAYTSGCTMRLMGIGSTSEMQADMLLCPSIAFDSSSLGSSTPSFAYPIDDDLNGDVLVTHPLPGSVHILTVDYLLHRQPAVILPAEGLLLLNVRGEKEERMKSTFSFHEAFLVGGSFAVKMKVGGATMRIVVDTGSSSPLSLGRSAGKRVKACSQPEGGLYSLTQRGVNGEDICSTAIRLNVEIGSIKVGEADALLNEEEVEGADGYAGIGILRSLDIWIQADKIGFRKNSNEVRSHTRTSQGKCKGMVLPSCATK